MPGFSHVVFRRVIVNLKSGNAIDGVLIKRSGPLLFLKNSVLLEPGRDPVALDGEVVIERAEVEFIQSPNS